MRIQILDYQVGPHTFRMVKPSDFNIFKALPSTDSVHHDNRHDAKKVIFTKQR